MTTYTTTAIATNSVTNTVTVASISNMVPGLPVTFSGVTFGGITTGSTYYIGTIIYGYPTSQITLTSLPGGAVFQLTTATGSMTAAWSSGGQQTIVTTPPGENLNTAFTKINTNFDQLWAAGPVNSNIKISNNTIYTLDTNGDLILTPNGTGNVVANAHVIPDTTRIRNLGSPTRYWDTIYVQYGNIDSVNIGQLTIPISNLHILGGNTNNFLQTDGTGNLTWSIPETAAGGDNTQIQYNNNGVLNGSNSFTFTSNTNTVTLQNVTTTGKANLNSVGNVQITGGTAGYVLQTDGSGNLSWTTPTGNINSILDQQIYGDGSTINFNLITSSVTNAVIVSINGVMQIPSVAYTVATDVITFAEAPQTSDLVDIRFLVFGEGGNNTPGGANGFIQFNSSGGFGGSGNLRYLADTGNLYSANISVSGNVTASYYYGDGSHLTGITATANTGTITFANNIISTSNANAAVNLLAPQQTSVSVATGGNAATAQLLWATNIGALSPAQINNGILAGNSWGTQISVGNTGAVIGSNSVAGLQTWTFGTAGTLSGAGGVVAGNITSGSDVTATANISAVGNVIGTYILGNVAFATGVPQSYGNSNVYALLNGSAANIVPLANVSYSLGNATNQWKDIWVSNSTIYMNSVPITLSSSNVLSVAGNAVVTTNNGSTNLGNIGFVGDAIYDFNGIVIENADLSHGATAAVVIPTNGSSDPVQINNTYGNIVLQAGVGAGLTAAWKFGNDGNLSLPAGNLAGLGNVIGPGNIAYPFGPGPVLLADNSANNSAYFSLTAVANADGVLGYVGIANFGGNSSTGLVETVDGTGNSYSWYFQNDGTTAFPSYTFPNVDGANGQALTTNGTGILSWSNVSGGNGNPFNQSLNTTDSVTFATVTTTGTGGDITTTGGNISGANYITGNFFVGDGSGLSNISVTANTGNITFNNSTLVGPSFGVVPSANSSVYIQPTVDSANVFQFGADGNITASGNLGVVVNSNLWSFDTNGTLTLPGNTLQIGLIAGNTGLVSQNAANITIDTTSGGGNTWIFGTDGELYLPTGGRLGVAGKNWTGLDGGNGNPVSLTSFYANGYYAGCITNNNDGNIIVSTYTGGGLQGSWTFDNGANLVLAPTNLDAGGAGSGESAKLRGTRKIVNGYTNTYPYSTVLAAGGTPTVAYTATDSSVQSVRVTFAIQGSSSVWEQFDVVVVQTLPQGNVNFTVTNRVKASDTPDTVVTATWNGTAIEIALTLDASQTGGGWASFDAVEFGLMAG